MLSNLPRRVAIVALVVTAVAIGTGLTRASAARPTPITVDGLRLFLLNHHIPVFQGVTRRGTRYGYTYLDLDNHPGKGIEVTNSPASTRYDQPSIYVWKPLPPGVRCRPESHGTKDEYATTADGRFCWTHYKAGPAGSDPKLNPAHWALSLYYRNIVVTWDFAGRQDRSIPPGVFAFDALMTQLLAAAH